MHRSRLGATVLEWEKIYGGYCCGIPFDEMCIIETQEKTDPRDTRHTDRFLLSHGKLRGFRVLGKTWTFPSPAQSVCQCVDPPFDESEDLVEIAGDKFMPFSWNLMEAEGARKRPYGIEYLSVHYDLSLLQRGAYPRFTFRGTEGSCMQISPLANCQQKIEFLVGKLASWLCDVYGGLVLLRGVRKSPGRDYRRDTAWHIS